MYQERRNVENMLILLLDILCVLCSSSIAYWIRFNHILGMNRHWDQIWQMLVICVLFVGLSVLVDFSRHFFRRGALEELASVVQEAVAFSAVWVIYLYILHQSTSLPRLVFGYFIVINTVLTYVVHLVFKHYMTHIFKYSRYSSRMLLATVSGRAQGVVQDLKKYNEWNRVLTGIVWMDRDGDGEQVLGYPVVANRENWIDYVIHNDIDEVFITGVDMEGFPEMPLWVSQLEQMGLIVDVNIDTFNLIDCGNKTLNRVGKYAVVTFARNLIPFRGLILKRILDIIGSLAGMALLGAATVVVGPLIKLESPGPVFFGQTRIGKNGRRFTCYKFRSMYRDAEERKKELMDRNEVKGLMFKMENDPRITRVGQFIRRTSIDELPQFWNILKGDMSLVGTRPPTVDEFERYEAKHKCRLSMTPGLTGLWQVSGRSDIKDFDEVVLLDMQYIDNWSILKDIKILIKTIGVVFSGRGSH